MNNFLYIFSCVEQSRIGYCKSSLNTGGNIKAVFEHVISILLERSDFINRLVYTTIINVLSCGYNTCNKICTIIYNYKFIFLMSVYNIFKMHLYV